MGGWERPWLWRAWPKQGRGLGGGRGQCSGPTGLEKALRALELRLSLKEQKGPRHAPHPWSQRAGDLTWEPSRLPGLTWARQTSSSPLLLLQSGVWESPSGLTLLIFLASLLCSQDQCSWGVGEEGDLEGRGLAWELSSLPVPE